MQVMSHLRLLWLLVLTLSYCSTPATALKVSGSFTTSTEIQTTWESHSKYLTKFGTQRGTPMYLYGNISVHDDLNISLVIATNDKLQEFMHLKSVSCNSHSSKLPFKPCRHDNDTTYRIISCNKSACNMPPSPDEAMVLKDSNFYLELQPEKSEYFHVFFLYCATTGSCNWHYTSHAMVEYSITVSRNPFNKHNPFYFQFPANLEGILIAYVTFSILYCILTSVHFILNWRRCTEPGQFRNYILIWLFTFSMIMESINVYLGLIHYSTYASNGKGIPAFFYLKNFFNLVGDWFLFIVLILVASGWHVTIRFIRWKHASLIIWIVYVLFSMIYYINEVVYLEIRPWKLSDPLQTWAGGLYLAIRGLVLFYVWYQIYDIHRQEEKLPKLRLYRTLVIMFSIWFWYLLALVFIVTFTGHVTASLSISIITTGMNFLTYVVMVVLFCPKWSNQYFQFESNDSTYTHLLSSGTKVM